MNFYIVIPAHNEENTVGLTLNSLLEQTLLPKKIVVVNDNSTDQTQKVVEKISEVNENVSLINIQSSNEHLPGEKIINAFYHGLKTLDDNYDVICKFDADLIFPKTYLEQLAVHFISNPQLGMASGFCYIEHHSEWILENLTRKDHIRGALKAYSKKCFEDIGGLRRSIGWDTVDELLARYSGWQILTDETLRVKHLKQTASQYQNTSKKIQGEALYKMRYGVLLTGITALKMAFKAKKISMFFEYLNGYFKAKTDNLEPLVTEDQGRFIRQLRWKGILGKLS